MESSAEKDRLKQLREKRKSWIEGARASIKSQADIIKRIRQQLEGGAKTIPQIAEGAGLETAQTLLVVSGLRKYGVLAEGAKEADYYSYTLAAKGDA